MLNNELIITIVDLKNTYIRETIKWVSHVNNDAKPAEIIPKCIEITRLLESNGELKLTPSVTRVSDTEYIVRMACTGYQHADNNQAILYVAEAVQNYQDDGTILTKYDPVSVKIESEMWNRASL